MTIVHFGWLTAQRLFKETVANDIRAVLQAEQLDMLDREITPFGFIDNGIDDPYQEKDADGISGYHFVINVEKSRYVKEKSKIPITVSYEGGINRWSGLLDVAIDGGYIVKPKAGWYATVDKETGEVKQPSMRASDIVDNKEFWTKIFQETDFAKYIESTYKMAVGSIMEIEDDTD